MGTARLGLDCDLYHGVAGAQASTLIENAENVTLTMERDEADVSTRGGGGWEEVIAGLRKGSVEFNQVYDPDDAAFAAIRDAYFDTDHHPLAFFIADGDGNGLDADFVVLNWNVDQPLREGSKVAVTIKPTRSTRAPQWISA